MNSQRAEDDFTFDVARSMILARYIDAWGQPKERIISRNESENARIEIYSFPPKGDDLVHRISSIGVSMLRSRRTRKPIAAELLFVLPVDLGGASFDSVATYLLDIAIFATRQDVWFEVGKAFPESPLAPKPWKPRGFLVDEPRGEPEELLELKVGRASVALYWIVPVFGAEVDLITSKGLDAFDKLDEAADASLADVRRPALVDS